MKTFSESNKKEVKMADIPSEKKPASRTRKTTRKPAVKKKRSKKTVQKEAKDILDQLSESTVKEIKKLGNKWNEEKDIVPHMSDATREQLKKLGDKLTEATDKGVHVAKDIAERVRHFASEATELTKLKVEIHKLKNARDKLLFEIGEKFVELYKNQKLANIESTFTNDLTQLEYIKSQIVIKEKAVKKISL
jgi:septal ring factor EnvC (AmiA/AmiB activator)